MKLWKIHSMEGEFPGLWRQWYRHQCVAVGFPPASGLKLYGDTKYEAGWIRARATLLQISEGDHIVVALKGNRVARLGQVTGKEIEDEQWNPLVPKSKEYPAGQMGRRIHVRWDLACGPENRDLVVALPEGARFTSGELRPTIAEVRSQSLKQLQRAMNEEAHWIGLLSHFRYEKALSDYIAAYPHHLEDGLVPYPNAKVRERIFKDRTRLDVLLLDRRSRPVIVECKQGAPTIKNLSQLRGYMDLLGKETGRDDVRGILVHGGARKLDHEVRSASEKKPRIEIVRYSLEVDFASDPSR